MKIKRNTISALILGCVLSANMALYANTVSQSEISGDWSAETTDGTTATAFSSSNLTSSSSSSDTVTSPLGGISVSEREIDYTFSYVDGVMYSEDPNGNIQETWGFIEDVEITRDEIYSDTLTDDDGNYLVIGYDDETYSYNSVVITKTAFETYFVPQYEDYIIISGGVVDLDLTATAIDGNAIAFDLTETSTDGTTSTGSLSDEYTVSYADIDDKLSGEITADLVDTVIGYMKIDATAIATGGDATAVLGDLTHSYLTINGENGVTYYKGANGDLTLNLTATATATTTDGGSTWTGGTAVGLDGTLDSEVGYSDVDIAATANGGSATGVSGDITIGSGDVYIVADANDIDAHVDGTYNVDALTSGTATAVSGTATFAGTTADLRAYSDSSTATAVTTLVATSGANVTLVANSATETAVGATTATLTDSTLTASVSGSTATGVASLTATDSDVSIGATATTTATGATTAEISGDTSLTLSVSSDATAVGVGALTAAYQTGDDLDVNIYVKGVTATAISTLSEVYSNDLTLNLTAVASGDSEAATAIAINSAVSFNEELDVSSSYSKTQELKGNIIASASAEDATATATAINSAVGEDGEDLIVSANVSAYAETTGDSAGAATATAISGNIYADITGSVYAYAESSTSTATATAISGNITGDISGTVSAVAVGSEATAISGNITGDISGTVSASASSTEDGDNATATAIDGTIDGTISGTISATATATGAGSNATATAIDTDGTSLTFDDATVSASASSESGTATAYAIDASGSLTVSGDVDVYGDVFVGGTFEVAEGEFSQITGSLTATAVNVNTTSGGEFTFSFNTEGDLSTVSSTITYKYDSTSSVESVLETVLNSSAAALVGDSDTMSDIKFTDTDTNITESLVDYVGTDTVDVEGSKSLDYTLTSDGTDVTATVTKTTYFQDKADTSNSATFGAALDAIVAKDESIDGASEWNQEVRETKVEIDGMNLDSFVPYTNSFISQANAESYNNLSLASIWRMRSLMDKTAKTARELAAEAIRNNPAYDGVDPDPISKPKRVAQFQSVNIVASRDGGASAPDYDFISTGGTADIDIVLTRDLVVGVGLGGIYNKVDGNSATGTAESTSAIINAYAMYALEDFDLFATLGYAHGFNESSKSTTEGTAKADWESDAIYHAAGFSYRIDFKNGIILRPMAMYNLVFQNYGKSKTSGGGDYDTSTSSESYLNFKTYLGGELIYRIDKNLELIARAFWVHEFADNSYDLTYSNVLTSPYIGSVAYDGEDADRDSFLVGLGVAYKFNKAVSAYLDYNANISGDYLGHNLNAAVQMKF